MVIDGLKWFYVGENPKDNRIKANNNPLEKEGFEGMFLAEKEKVGERILNGETETKIMLGGSEFSNKQWKKLIDNVDNAIKPEGEEPSIIKLLGREDKNCPYASLAKDGIIEHNGVIFTCDYERNSINLGAIGPGENYLTISLPSGGFLNINVDNFGDIARCTDMFSPSDLNVILDKIREYNHCTATKNKIDSDNAETAVELGDEG